MSGVVIHLKRKDSTRRERRAFRRVALRFGITEPLFRCRVVLEDDLEATIFIEEVLYELDPHFLHQLA